MDIKKLKQYNHFRYITTSNRGHWEGMIYIEGEGIYLFQNSFKGASPKKDSPEIYGYLYSYKVYPTEGFRIRQTIIDNLEILPIIC